MLGGHAVAVGVPAAGFGTEISAKGRGETLDPKIVSWPGEGGTRVAPAAGLDVALTIPTASPWGQRRARFSLACN